MPSYADLINKAKKDFKCDTLMSGNTATTIPKIPLSAPFMNYALYGGIPRGRMTEFFGEPGSGKSTTAVDACKNAAKILKLRSKNYERRLQMEQNLHRLNCKL